MEQQSMKNEDIMNIIDLLQKGYGDNCVKEFGRVEQLIRKRPKKPP